METQQKMTVSEVVVETLKQLGVRRIFLIPGGASMHLDDATVRLGIPYSLCGDEIGAGFQAQVYGAMSETAGVMEVTSGPAALKALVALKNAKDDSQALMVLTGNVATDAPPDAFQATKIVQAALAGELVKDAAYVDNPDRAQEIIFNLYNTAVRGRKGSVLVDIPRNIQNQRVHLKPLEELASEDYDYTKAMALDRDVIREIAYKLRTAERPLLIIGQGARGTEKEIARLVEQENLYAISTLFGLRDLIHDRNLGMGGMNGESYANLAHTSSNCRFYIGTSIDDRLMLGSHRGNGLEEAVIVHVDISQNQIGKVMRPTYGIVADAKEFLRLLLEELENIKVKKDHSKWNSLIETWRKELTRNEYLARPDLISEHVIDEVKSVFGNNVYVVADVGAHQMRTAQSYKLIDFTSGRLACMGFGLAASVGLITAVNDYNLEQKPIINIIGDGGMIMALHEWYDIARTIAEFGVEKTPIKTVEIVDGHLGMVTSWQEVLYPAGGKRTSDLTFGGKIKFDFTKAGQLFPVVLADGDYTIPCRIVTTREDLSRAVREMYETPGPYILQAMVPALPVTPTIFPGGNTYSAAHSIDSSGRPIKLLDVLKNKGLI